MIPVFQIALRLKVLPPIQVTGNNESKQILPDVNNTADSETPIYRLFQNITAGNLYYLIGATPADGTNQYHGILQQYQQLDCSGHRSAVQVFGTGAYTAVATVMMRTDKYGDNIIPSNV